MTVPRLKPTATALPQAAQQTMTLPRGTGPGAFQPNEPFLLVFQHKWYFYEDAGENGEWLPDLDTIPLTRGCNGCRGEPGGPVDATGLKIGFMAKKAVIIERDDPRLRPFCDNYLFRYPVAGGGYFYCLPHVGMTIVKGGRAAIRTPDHQWYHGFKRHLMEVGVVDPMPIEILHEKITMQRAQLSSKQKYVGKGWLSHDAYQSEVQRVTDMTERWTEAWEKQFGDAPAKGVVVRPAPAADLEGPPEDEITPAPVRAPRKRGG